MPKELLQEFAALVCENIVVAAPIHFRCGESYGDGETPYRVPVSLQTAFSVELAAIAKEIRLVRSKSHKRDVFPAAPGKEVGSFLILSPSEHSRLSRYIIWSPAFEVIVRVELSEFLESGLLVHCFDPAPLVNPGTLCAPLFRLIKKQEGESQAWVHLYRSDDCDIPHVYLWTAREQLVSAFRNSLGGASLTTSFMHAIERFVCERRKTAEL